MPSPVTHAQRMLKHSEQVEMIRDWNAAHSIGADVTYRRDFGGVLHTTTRSQAQLLNGHTAVIWLEGVAGCVALERVTPRAV